VEVSEVTDAEIHETVEENTLTHDGTTYVRASDARGVKVQQVAVMVEELQKNPGIPHLFEDLCTKAGQKYPQDIQAAMIALELTEFVDRYNRTDEVGHRARSYYCWVGPVDPTNASVGH
jgi:hypothetical protein